MHEKILSILCGFVSLHNLQSSVIAIVNLQLVCKCAQIENMVPSKAVVELNITCSPND